MTQAPYTVTRRDRVAVKVANWWLRRVCSLGYLVRLDDINRRGLACTCTTQPKPEAAQQAGASEVP